VEAFDLCIMASLVVISGESARAFDRYRYPPPIRSKAVLTNNLLVLTNLEAYKTGPMYARRPLWEGAAFIVLFLKARWVTL